VSYSLPPFRTCVACGKGFRAWQDSGACPPCRRETAPDRAALANEIAARHEPEQLTLDQPPRLAYNEFPPDY
jgi:hypothetical protein